MKRILLLTISMLVTMAITAQTTPIRTKNFTTRDGLASNVVNCGLQDRQGYIWLGTNHGLTRFDGHRFDNFYIEEYGERQLEGITDLVEDTVKNVLLLAGKGYRLLCFDLKKMRFVSSEGMTFPNDPNDEKQEHAYMEQAKQLGIDRGNKTNRRHDLHYARLADGRELFATIDNGFYIYEPNSKLLQHYRATDEQPIIESDYINGVLKDRSGGIWLLTTFAGIYRLEFGEEAMRYHTLASNIRSFAQLDSTHIAVADMEGRVFGYNPDNAQSTLLFNEGVRAYALATDSKGRLWIGTRGRGVWINDHSILNLQSLPAKQIYDIKFSPKGTVWIATLDGGLIEGHERLGNQKTGTQDDSQFFFLQHLEHEGIHEIDLDDLGRLWIACERGILMKDGQDIDTVYNKSKVVCICHSPNGAIWAGTNGYGLLKIEQRGSAAQRTLSYLQTGDGLANNCVESVACDAEGNVYAGTDQGVSIVSSDGSVRTFYSQQGLRANTYNENAILCTDKGRVFLGSLTGLVELQTTRDDMFKAQGSMPPPRITCIEVNNEPRYDLPTREIHLSHDQNNLCFSFSSFAYTDLSSVVYSYWLKGVDRDWRPSTKESKALYPNLSPGHYKLYVRSRLAGTPWSQETVCDVHVAQPWYWTWWARALYLLAIILFVGYELHQYQQRMSLRRQLDQRLSALYAIEAQQEHAAATAATEAAAAPEATESTEVTDETEKTKIQEKTETTAPVPQKDRDFLDKLDRLILENMLQTDLDVNFIAQEMCVSYSTLHRRIKSLTGMSANEYVRKHRLAKAMQLLQDGHNATEVSMECGFNSPSYFTRCFKAEYGMLPSEVLNA